ncbi:DUF4221 family protein [Marivirga sp.]|uniref:DUF4221 family protein n=1 Tax=Marivirga sp. TaxID=2018662 RepID=UPI002D7EB51A|nr:DUF4221 family protein [Marivirga sp.]HET8861101.1 DUF4221 family protein [Marivirga sp.]
MKNLIIILIILASCDSKKKTEIYFQEANGIEFNDSLSLEETAIISLNLDNETSFHHKSMKSLEIDNTSYLSFINAYNQHFYLYNLETGELEKKLKLDREGPNGVGHLTIFDHAYLSDSLLLYNTWDANLYILDYQGNLLSKNEILDFSKNSNSVSPEPATMKPIRKVGDYVFIPCSINQYLTDYSNQNSVIRYNLKTQETDYMINLPDNYNQGYWGATFKYKISFDMYGSDLISSFPIDNFIYRYNSAGKYLNKYYVGSKFIKEFEPFKEDINYGVEKDHSVPNQQQGDYSWSNSDYNAVIYDEFRDLFYRVAYIRPKKAELEAGRSITNFSIMILTSNFEKVGEQYFDGLKYHPTMILVSKQGLLMARSDLYKENEELLSFSVFNIAK